LFSFCCRSAKVAQLDLYMIEMSHKSLFIP
jgi:hypothetical protein